MNEPSMQIGTPDVYPEPTDFQKSIAAMPGPKPISLRDVVERYGFSACLECFRGGHTGHTLFTVITDVVHGTKALACQDHVSKYLRPHDIKSAKK